MKPKIFLSHSSKDKPFIKKVADILRLARIDCWYDDWEIPPGESIRRKIFEDGMPGCDLFLVYLSENSISSYWVQKELDSMISIESESRERLLLPFISNENLRQQLTPDLKAINIPELNDNNLLEPICKLIARTWEVFTIKQLNKQKETALHVQTQLKNQNLELENKILQLQLAGNTDIEATIKQLQETHTYNNVTLTLQQLFTSISVMLADGANKRKLIHKLSEEFKFEQDAWGYKTDQQAFEDEVPGLLGRLVILGLITRIAPTSEYMIEEYGLSALGIKLANRLTTT